MNSPLIQQDGDCKQLKLRFDVSQYKPEEIVVKTVDNKLLVGSNVYSVVLSLLRYNGNLLFKICYNWFA